MFLVEKNGVGALNPLAVNDKRYYWKGLFGPCIFVTRATLFEGIKFCCLLEMSFTANSFIDVTWFSEKQWTFAYCIQISKDLDTISKSLKIFIQFFIGYPNTCTWCGIHAVICSWLYELLMSLRSIYEIIHSSLSSTPAVHIWILVQTFIRRGANYPRRFPISLSRIVILLLVFQLFINLCS